MDHSAYTPKRDDAPEQRRRTGTQTEPRVLLVLPPLTQLNTPYPSTAYLTGLLSSRGILVEQADLGLETALRLFCRNGLERLFSSVRAHFESGADKRDEIVRALAEERRYVATIDRVVRFLQGKDPTFATRICHGGVLPAGPRFDHAESEHDLSWAFGALGTTDQARYLATLYLEDLADLARETVAPHFALSRYGERLALSAASFDPLLEALAAPPDLIDTLLDEALRPLVDRVRPDLVGLSVPFPGNLYGALRIAQTLRRVLPATKIALGGGYANTELRQLGDPRLFDFIDFLTLDDGERPMLCLVEHLAGSRDAANLRRTSIRERGKIIFVDGASESDVAMAESAAPTYRGLPLDRYLSVLEVLNPMHRLWSEGHWNKLTVAHGCYWKKCAFCDVGLDYIARYEPASARMLVEHIEALVAETGQSGFHFVDEAAPPLALVELALELLVRGQAISWWGNIRFEKTFTLDVCRLLAASGCIAVTGGLEVASDRLLDLMKKGVSVAQVARVTRAFADAGVLVHAYLMYGFPTQTEAETIDSLEMVRQLFVAGAIQSAFWHRFALTRHSPIAADLPAYKLLVKQPSGRALPSVPPPAAFANNDLAHVDATSGGADPDLYGEGLRRALFNYMHSRGLEEDVRRWFEPELASASKKASRRALPKTKVPSDFIAAAIADPSGEPARPNARVVWIGGTVEPGREGAVTGLIVRGAAAREGALVPMPARVATWAAEKIRNATPQRRSDDRSYETLPEIAASFPGGVQAFGAFVDGDAWASLRELGLLVVP